MDQSASGSDVPTDKAALVNTLYQALLGRDADPEGLAHYTSIAINEGLYARDIALRLMESSEFVNTNSAVLSRLPSIRNFDATWMESTTTYYDKISKSGITLSNISDMYRNAGLSNDEYTLYHLNRFHELFGFLTSHFSPLSGSVEILEIGTSAHSTPFYRRFIDCQYDTICRPITTGGPTQEWASKAGSRRHWQVDLNYPERYVDVLEMVPRGYYDAVICTEVIEHLMRAPRDLIRFALSTIKEQGILYLTTPNFLVPTKIYKIYEGGNPALGFEDYQNNVHAHHHFREYTVSELACEVSWAGGRVKDVVLSNCWDGDLYHSQHMTMFRSNIVMTVVRGDYTAN